MTRLMADPAKYPARIVVPIQDAEGRYAWPEAFGESAAAKIQQDVTLSAWHSECLLSPISGDTQIFQEAWTKQTWETLDLSKFDRIVAASDPSTTNTRQSDYKATVVMGHCRDDNKAYILHVVCERVSVNKYFERLHELQGLYGGPCYVEDNGVKEFLYSAQATYEKEHACHLNIQYVTHGGNKNQRIQGTLESPFERGLIILPPLTHGHTRLFIDQLLAFPNGSNDDAIDAAAEAGCN
jgi:predicted phage terminase large subunit-like protein